MRNPQLVGKRINEYGLAILLVLLSALFFKFAFDNAMHAPYAYRPWVMVGEGMCGVGPLVRLEPTPESMRHAIIDCLTAAVFLGVAVGFGVPGFRHTKRLIERGRTGEDHVE